MFKKIFARKKFFFLSFLTICSLPYFQFPLTVQGQAQSFQRYSEIEEMPQWNKQCQRFTDGYPQTDCNQNMTSLDSQTKKSGAYSLKLQGEKSLKNIYQINLPVKPGTKYKISSWIKIQDRKCYNYLDLGYPSAFTSIDPERVSTVQHTRGIWCGMFFLKTNESGGTASNLLQPIIIDYPYISHSSWDWYYEEGFIQTSSQATSLTITFELEGFDGKMWIDGLTLQEVESFIEDKYLHIPIKYEFQGMKIKQVSQNPLFVETNAGKFIFSNNNIQLQKNNETMSTLTFSSANFLQNLQIKQEEGLVILENVNVIFSLGADSSLLTKLKNNVSLNIEGKKPNYHNFEAGVIFATDYTKGILFSPIYSPQMLQSMPYS